ncbi:hypothetical protein Cantr_01148 [Candida viswanathii]|uniref:Uncharacterized protein n=1 Tax=Candida viswanathii TaxID=5486 RepID=A0A367YJ82_9ASCO|nr:hypothetical protein Cantr_01148 [Candida viswanathii]
MMMMMLSLLLLALLNSCLSLTLTSPPIASVTAVDGASPGAKKNTFNIAVSDTCLVTYVNGQVETTHTFIPCAQHASEVPYGCTFTDLKTLCPPEDHCAWSGATTLDNGCYEIWKQSFDMVELLTTCPETVTTESPLFDNAVTTSTRVLSNGCFEVWKQSYDVIETSTWCIEPPYTPTQRVLTQQLRDVNEYAQQRVS